MKTKIVKVVSLLICIVLICTILSSCALMEALMKEFARNVKHFEDWIKVSDDGFTYYYNEYNNKGVYILDIPTEEEVIIPEYINGKKVKILGYQYTGVTLKLYQIVGTNTKKLTIQHQFYIGSDNRSKFVDFPNLTNLTFIDFLYCYQSYEKTELLVPHFIGNRTSNTPVVELKKSNRKYSLEDFNATVIYIPDYVKVIEAGVFDGLEGVIIKTSYETKPEGWQDGWNGTCEVVWGEDITVLNYDFIKRTSSGYTYYYNETTGEGAYLLGVQGLWPIIPEYIDGKRVVELGHKFGDYVWAPRTMDIKELTIKHQFKVCENMDPFEHLTRLKFIDFLYCFQFYENQELIVPHYIGKRTSNIPIVELKKSDREYSLENFKATVIYIPDYVKVIEAGVFDGLEGVIIKTSYETKPEGWQDGWNGTCEVVWGV